MTNPVEVEWRYWVGKDGKGYFVVLTNEKGSCRKRTYDAINGLRGDNEKSIKNMDYQIAFRELLKTSIPVSLSRRVNLEESDWPSCPARSARRHRSP